MKAIEAFSWANFVICMLNVISKYYTLTNRTSGPLFLNFAQPGYTSPFVWETKCLGGIDL